MPMMTRRDAVLLTGAGLLVPGWMKEAQGQNWAKMAAGQAWAKDKLDQSPRHREYVAVKAPAGRFVSTFVVYPEVAGKAPAVVLIHEIFGLSDWVKLMADELAAKGYVVLVPDLLSGMGPAGAAQPGGTGAFPDVDAVVKGVTSLPDTQVMADLNAVADYAQRSISAADGTLAVGGFCWGGGKTFDFATQRKGLRGAYVFYGPAPAATAMTTISAPVYGFYAGNDARITTTVPETVKQMKAAGKTYEPVIYDGAGHGFMRAGQASDASPANKKAWEEGFARLLQLLGRR